MLKFYIISTIISGFVSLVNITAIGNKLKREGYVRDFKPSIAEKLQGMIVICVPILNILLALYMIFNNDQCYETLKKSRIKV